MQKLRCNRFVALLLVALPFGQADQSNGQSRHDLPADSQQKLVAPRPPGAIGGRQFIEAVKNLALDEREAAIEREITSGNFPEFLRNFKTISLRGAIVVDGGKRREVAVRMEVMPDYLSIGTDVDFVRMPITPGTAQRIADHFGCVLPTRKIVDAIDSHAELKLAPQPLTNQREAVTTFLQHHEIIEKQRGDKQLGLLVSGIKKDIVLSARIFDRPNRVAIYGWRKPDGQPIQPLSIVHSDRYVDYSHGVRLVHDGIQVDGKASKLANVMRDPALSSLISDEGPIDPPCYAVD